MTTVTFDTLEATRRLKEAGFNEKQAEAAVRIIIDAQERLVTREHFDSKLEALELRLTIKIGALLAAVGGIIIAVLKSAS